MNWVAWKMLTGDTTKYLGIVFGVAFGTLLIAQQSSIFVGLMRRCSSTILDITEGDVWAFDKRGENVDEIRPLPDNRLYQVRGVPGVEWAVRLYKGQVRFRLENGNFRQAILVGIDDATLIGAPRKMILGQLSDLRRPDAVFVDRAGYEMMFPGEPLSLGKTLEMNDRRAVILGICDVHAPFQTFPVIYARYNQATRYAPRERNVLSFVLAKAAPGVDLPDLCQRIETRTNLKALSDENFFWYNIGYYIRSTGIPVNFGITVTLGFIVGAAIAGQTFYLFTIENLKQFGALKAMGVNNLRILGMILLQALVVGTLGFSLGLGMSAGFFELMELVGASNLRGMYVPWQIMAITLAAVGVIVVLSSILSAHKVLVLEPAVVFK